ncbi:MAG: PAS domain S-box protein [Ignavibacteriales bacterium]|nr:PAS domain S-box protein [Ignavibacteriales bacterium]
MAKRTRSGPLQVVRKAPKPLTEFTATIPVAYVELELKKKGSAFVERVVEWNKTAEVVTGLKRRQMIGKSVNDFFPNSINPPVLRRLVRVFNSGKSATLHNVHLRSGEKSLPMTVAAWKVTRGVGLLLSSHSETITNEDDFSESVSILDSITDAFFLLDGEWRFAYLSPKSTQFLTKLNLSKEELLGKNIWEIIPDVRGTAGEAAFHRAMRERTTLEFEEFYKPLNIWFEVHVHPIANGLSVYVKDISRRKLAESAFLKLSNAVEQSADAVLITNPAGHIEYVNPAFEEITGYRRSEALGKTPQILGSNQEDVEFSHLWHQVQSGETFRATVVNRKKSGDLYYADETITPVRDSHGAITHFVATLRDITERKRTEERFRALIERSSDGIALLNEDGTIRYTGPSTGRILGYEKEDFTGRLAFEFIHQDDRVNTERTFHELIKSPGGIVSLEYRLKHNDGTWKWIEATANNLLEEPNVQAVVVNYRDISDRKHIEGALKKSEIEYRNLFDRANDAIFIFEPHGEVILEANDKACELYGFSKDELVGMSLKNLTKDISRGESEIKELLRHQQSRNFETVHFNKKGEPMEMLVNSSVVEYAGRTAIMSIIRDISEIKRLEHQLRQAQKMESMGTLAGGVAHDFNNILSIILGYTSLIKRGRIDGEKFDDGVDTIIKAAQRGATLVRQILTFARKTDIVFESVKLNELVIDLTKLLRETFPRTITFDLRLDPAVPPIVADTNQLHQVFMNLCVNARDAISDAGTITIETSMIHGLMLQDQFRDVRESEYVHVVVRDSGTGMDEQTRSRIFEPFFTTKRQGQGTGLGLAVVYGIVNNHGGFIDVESKVGKGTTFHLYFPVQMRSLEPLRAGTGGAEDIPGGSETILVVEDEQMLQSLVKELLETHGYRVLTAHDGVEAVDTFSRLKDEIDLVLTDIGLPKLSGWDVCRRIIATKPEAKVILASGYIDPTVKSELKDSRAKEYIHKPYLPEDVLRRVRNVLDAP